MLNGGQSGNGRFVEPEDPVSLNGPETRPSFHADCNVRPSFLFGSVDFQVRVRVSTGCLSKLSRTSVSYLFVALNKNISLPRQSYHRLVSL